MGSSFLVIFVFGRLRFWSSSFLVVFVFGCLRCWSSSFLVVFVVGRLPFCMYVQQRSVCLFLCICRIWLLDKDTGSTGDNSSVPLSRSVSSVSLTKRQGSQWIIPLLLCQGISDCPTSSP